MDHLVDHLDTKKRIAAAQSLLLENTTSLEKFSAIRVVLSGINPRIDELLQRADSELHTLKKLYEGNVIDLALEHLPESTEEEKKRKRALVLFVSTWKDLSGEVARVSLEMQTIDQAQTSVATVQGSGKILGGAKGAFGIVTVVAVGIVLALQTVAVQLSIQNQGCGELVGSGTAFALPGLSVPNGPISENATVVATLPPLTLTIDGNQTGKVILSALTFNLTIDVPQNAKDILLDDISLVGKIVSVNLSSQKQHTLVLVCS